MKYDVESVEKKASVGGFPETKMKFESFLSPSWNLDVTFQQSRHNWKKPSRNLKPPFTKILPTIISFSVSQQRTHPLLASDMLFSSIVIFDLLVLRTLICRDPTSVRSCNFSGRKDFSHCPNCGWSWS